METPENIAHAEELSVTHEVAAALIFCVSVPLAISDRTQASISHAHAITQTQ
jgi:hypothetical protein